MTSTTSGGRPSKTSLTGFQATQEEKARIRARAEELKKSISGYIRDLILADLDGQNARPSGEPAAVVEEGPYTAPPVPEPLPSEEPPAIIDEAAHYAQWAKESRETIQQHLTAFAAVAALCSKPIEFEAVATLPWPVNVARNLLRLF